MAIFDPTKPSGSLPASQGGGDLRTNGAALVEALARELTFPGTDGPGGTGGRPLAGAARIFVGASAPTQVSATAALDDGRLWSKSGVLSVYETIWKQIAAASYGASHPADAYAGALDVDSADGLGYVFNGTIWTPLKAKWRHNPQPKFASSVTNLVLSTTYQPITDLSVAVTTPASGTWDLLIMATVSATNGVAFQGSFCRIAVNDGTTTTYGNEVWSTYPVSSAGSTPMLHGILGATLSKTYTVTVDAKVSNTSSTLTVNGTGSASSLIVIPFYRGD